MDMGGWASVFTDLSQEWRSVVGSAIEESPVEDWPRLFEQFTAEQGRLKANGLWVSGHSDLMHLARVADGELTHSNLVAWLLDPAGRHRFGDRLLVALMAEGWPNLPMPQTDGAVVEREVPRGGRIADIVIYAGQTTLVIENKVWAPESPRQCDDLYEIWLDFGPDVRYLLLTPDGHPPRETRSQAAADAWRSMSYASLACWLTENLPPSPQSLAQKTVEQYVATIRETWRGTRPFRIGVGGGNVGE
jgi:PD-(D/E)XK nuclease superfamily